MDKSYIRRNIKAIKRTLSDAAKREAAKHVFFRLEAIDEFVSSQNILIYHSLPDELSTIEFINKWNKRKNLFLPRVNGENLEILAFDSNLLTGAFNIKEPAGDNIVDINSLDLIIVPAIAFDCKGNRIGRGKGYYDRLLKSAKGIMKIVVGYDFQLIDDIESELHDIPVDVIITDKHMITVSNH